MTLEQLKYIAGIFALLGITACTDEETVSVASPNMQEAVLSARKSHIITRAGDEVTQFDEGTKYLLYANGGTEWLLYNTEGTEQANHTIGYGMPLAYGNAPISFYGVTYGTADSPSQAPENTPLGVPMIAEKVTDNSLPDLMFSNNLTNQTLASNGYRLEMDFKHAMSKLEFMIVKQDESEDDEKKLENVKLKSIELTGMRTSGTLDIVNGKWEYKGDKTSRTYYTNEEGLLIGTTSTQVSDQEFLIFPNEDEVPPGDIIVKVTLSGIDGKDGKDEVVEEYALKESNEDNLLEEEWNKLPPFKFRKNHRYVLLITVLKDEVRTIAIAPQVYDWIDENRDDNYLGQPVTFANLMWMDRNLGAKSADCENDWENCRGYYYQYARNIPYILDKEKYDAASNKIPVYPFLYTYDQYGEKVYGGVAAGDNIDNIPVRYPNIAINPGDKGLYLFIWDPANNGIWLYNENNNSEHSFIDEYWTSDNNNHPCPKGWRLPTRADFASFLPERRFPIGTWYNGYQYSFNYTANTLNYYEDEVHGTINEERAIYIIKRKGRPDCYRIRILLKESNTPGKSYYEFAYFPGDATMKFDGLTTEAAFVESMNNGLFDWNSPSAIMQIPACGFIHTIGGNKLDGDGVSTVLRSSDWARAGYNWVCYLRSDQSFGLFDGSRKALGDQIRCVRDVTAK